jgi:hypothetical protein
VRPTGTTSLGATSQTRWVATLRKSAFRARRYVRWLDYAAAARSGEMIVVAGMPRSASTWLYNVARLSLAAEGDLAHGWIEDAVPLRRHGQSTLLVKTHGFEGPLARSADVILYSFRDVRDVVASVDRVWGRPPTMAMVHNFLYDDRRWRRRAHLNIRYEDMIRDQTGTAARVMGRLGMPEGDAARIVERVGMLRPPDRAAIGSGRHSLETLLHPGHITDGRAESWRGQLDPTFVARIERAYGAWLEANGYSAEAA